MSDGDEEYITLLDSQSELERIEEEIKYDIAHPPPAADGDGSRTPPSADGSSGFLGTPTSSSGATPERQPPNAESDNASSASSPEPQPPPSGSSRLSRKRKQGTYKVRRRKHRGVS